MPEIMHWLQKLIAAISEPSALIQLYPLLLSAGVATALFSSSGLRRRCLQPLMALCCGWCVLCYVLYAASYLLHPALVDHVEPCVIDTARISALGNPVYHDAASASRYTLLYGPNAYLVPRLGLAVAGESMVAMKLPGVILGIMALAIVVAAVCATTTNRMGRYLAITYFCGVTLLFREKYFWMRSDPQLLVWSALGAFAVTRRSPLIASALLGISLGGAIGAKFHSGLAFCPVLALAMPRATPTTMFVTAMTALGTISLPFAVVPEMSWRNYLMWLMLASRHGLGYNELAAVFTFLGVLVLPLALSVAACGYESLLISKNRGRLLFAAIGVLTLAVLSSKRGSAEWHLMPLIPGFALLLAQWHDSASDSSLSSHGLGAFVALNVITASIGAMQGINSAAKHHSPDNPIQLAAADIRTVLDKHQGATVAMGYGDEASYRLSWLRPLLPMQTNLLIDAAALMDMHASGLPLPDTTIDALRHGVIDLWLIPRDQAPFGLPEYYHRQPTFPDEFRQVFAECYEPTERLRCFDVWSYRGIRDLEDHAAK